MRYSCFQEYGNWKRKHRSTKWMPEVMVDLIDLIVHVYLEYYAMRNHRCFLAPHLTTEELRRWVAYPRCQGFLAFSPWLPPVLLPIFPTDLPKWSLGSWRHLSMSGKRSWATSASRMKDWQPGWIFIRDAHVSAYISKLSAVRAHFSREGVSGVSTLRYQS